MNAQRIMRQLRREVKANPKRAALLAGLIAVGIYFWAPLIAGWAMPEKAETPPVSKGGAVPAANLAAPAAGKTATESPKPQTTTPWAQLWAAIQNDKRTKPATALVAAADPFRPFPAPPEPQGIATEDNANGDKAVASDNQDPLPRVATPTEATPKSLGMKLTGTVIGLHRAAVIDGKIVSEGSLVSPTTAEGNSESGKSSKAGKIGFRLVRVERQSIVLERNAKQYTLAIEAPQSDGIELAVIPSAAP